MAMLFNVCAALVNCILFGVLVGSIRHWRKLIDQAEEQLDNARSVNREFQALLHRARRSTAFNHSSLIVLPPALPRDQAN